VDVPDQQQASMQHARGRGSGSSYMTVGLLDPTCWKWVEWRSPDTSVGRQVLGCHGEFGWTNGAREAFRLSVLAGDAPAGMVDEAKPVDLARRPRAVLLSEDLE